MKIIILAGGRGTRLANSAKDIPKALVSLANKPMLQHQIDLLKDHGFSDIRLSLGFRAEQIVNYLNGKYEYVIEQEPLGTGGAIKFASADLTEPFMVLNGDIVSDVDVKSFAASHLANSNNLVVCHHKKNTDFGLLKIDQNGKIRKFLEKPASPADGYVSVGFYILQPQIFENIPKKNFSIEYDVFPELAEQGQLHSFEHKGFWTDLGTEERLNEFLISNEISNSND